MPQATDLPLRLRAAPPRDGAALIGHVNEEIAALCRIAHGHGLTVHMDGARFANALSALGCSPAEMTWRAGIDILSFGASKNGALAATPAEYAKAKNFLAKRILSCSSN